MSAGVHSKRSSRRLPRFRRVWRSIMSDQYGGSGSHKPIPERAIGARPTLLELRARRFASSISRRYSPAWPRKNEQVLDQVEIQRSTKVHRSQAEIERSRRYDHWRLPEDLIIERGCCPTRSGKLKLQRPRLSDRRPEFRVTPPRFRCWSTSRRKPERSDDLGIRLPKESALDIPSTQEQQRKLGLFAPN